jgi:hypothetical protein
LRPSKHKRNPIAMAFSSNNSNGNSSSNNEVFADDDEETWKKIVSFPPGAAQTELGKGVGPLLSGLAERLREDWHVSRSKNSGGGDSDEESYWQALVAVGQVDDGSSYQSVEGSSSREADGGGGDISLPEAFRTERGTKHLEATTALLGLSKQRAVQVTMGALRSVDVDTEGNNSQQQQQQQQQQEEGGSSSGNNNESNKKSKKKSKPDGNGNGNNNINNNGNNNINNNGNDNFSSLLGTRELLAKTVAYHHKQRSARLSVLAECLRLEQDPSSSIRGVIAQTLLDPLDDATTTTTTNNRNRKRGLFKSLLVAACLPDPAPKREALEPAKSLSGSYSTIGNSNGSSNNDSSASARFGADLFAELLAQKTRERTQAMEGLLALLYQRLDGGIHPRDFSILVAAFFGTSPSSSPLSSFANRPSGKDARWHQLAGLICAECMALWRAFEPPTEQVVAPAATKGITRGIPTPSYESWTESHPLLDFEGFGSSVEANTIAIERLEKLAHLLVERADQAQHNDATRGPLSLALLSFGLLLCLASDSNESHTHHKSLLRELGENLVNLANDEGGAFDCLREVVSDLTSDALSDLPTPVSHGVLYDWQLQLRNRTNNKGGGGAPTLMLLDRASSVAAPSTSLPSQADASNKAISADIVAYTSIAREILAASIASFSENLLAIDQTDSCKNIGMLCQLVASIFKNNEPLCQQFWESWESYLSTTNNNNEKTISQHEFPMCRLLDAAYNLSRQYLSGFIRGQLPRGEFLEATAPFFRLLSVLCHTPTIAETMIDMLPPTMIRIALKCCASDQTSYSDATTSTTALPNNLVSVLESFEGLAKIASSSATCLAALRGALESPQQGNPPEDDFYEGPLLLASLLNNPSADSRITRHVLGTIANLLKGAPKGWAIPMAQQFIDQTGGSGDSATSRLVPFVWTNEEPLSHSAILVMEELIGHMSQVVFSGGDVSALSFLQSLGAALLTSMTCLATTRISTASVETAEIVFRSLANFLKWIKPIVHLHASEMVREGASNLRDSLLQTLATSNGLGEVLVYYATAPVSLGLLLKMEETVLDQAIAEQVSRDDDSEAAQKYGPWYSMSSSYKGHSSGASLSKSRVLDFLSKMTPEDFDLAGVRARGWTRGSNPNGVATLDASRSAILLLSEWAASVEDVAKTKTTLGDGIGIPSELLLLPPNEDANEVLTFLSPHRLLCTMAPMPMQCHSDARMSALWQSLEVSTFDLLLPFLHRSKEKGFPLSIVLDLLNACLSHLRLTVPKGELATSTLLRTIVQSTRFSSLLAEIVERGIKLAGNDGNSKDLKEPNQGHYQNAFLGLQIISSCIASAPTVAHAILGLGEDNRSGLSAKLVEGALYAKKVLDLAGSRDIFATEGSILQMRMASGCLNVLSALWKTTRVLFQGKTSDTVGSALLKEVGGQLSSFVPDLVQLVSDYANSKNLEDRIVISNSTEFGRVSTMSFLTSALEILANAHVFESSEEGGNNAATLDDVLTNISKSRRLLRSNNYALSATSSKHILEIDRHVGLQERDPLSLLSSFPALASNLQPNDFYQRENSFDLHSLSRWLASIGGEDESSEEFCIIRDALDKASLLHHLTKAELYLMDSWKKFLEIAVFRVYFSNGCVIAGSTLQILKNLTLDTLYSLRDNLSGGASAQTEFSTSFMSREICAMSSCLGDLLLFQLEIGAFDLLPLGELLEIARALAAATKSLQDVACPEPTDEADQIHRLESYCRHQQTLLSCALVVCGLIEKREHSRPDQGVQGDIYLSLCLTNCKFVQAFSRMCNQDNICHKTHTTTIRSCASFFTLLVIGYQGDRLSNASYTTMLSNSFREYEVLKLLMQYATFLSTSVGNSLSSTTNSNPSAEDREILDVIKAVLNLLHAIADTNDPEIIRTLHSVELSQLAVRNPLFNLRSPKWSQQDPTQVQPRGYVFKRETVTISNQKSSIYVGSEDPVYEIWLASMQVLGACVRTSSHFLNDSGGDNVGTGFLDMSIEFLRVYKVPLLVCLKSCVNPSKMTRFALREAKVLVAMVAELCKRNVRTSFVSSNLQLCEEFLEHSKRTMTSLISFLGAVGTSSELFAAIELYESTDQDRYEDLKTAPVSQLRLSLLSIGLPMAKQKAMRLSNYASSRIEKLSQEDFESATIVPDYLKSLSQKRAYESNSEQICRLSVTNQFSLGLVRASAEFVYQALSLVLRTHAISKSFYTFSEADRAIDCMNLIEPGIVIGYRPNIGQSMLFDSSGFECLRFGRVRKADTFARTWEVEVIRHEGNDREVFDGRKETVQAVQLAGIEDKSARKPSTSLLAPAPDSMTDFENTPGYLTTGNYILILRWCHQQTTLLQAGTTLDAGFETPSYIQQIAEQASILLGADLVLHGLNGSFQNKDKKEMSQLDHQIFELFADKALLAVNLENEEPSASSFPEGRMKEVVDSSVWNGLQSQIRPFVQRAWKVRQEIERKRTEKRMNAGDTEFFSGFRRKGKSAFRR